jgi:NADPH:quinone reductase-like Zn-dependent oxidoreductase
VVSTASPRNHAFVKSLGADEVFDYNDPQCAQKIKDLTNSSLRLTWDTISLDSSAKICAEAMADGPGGRYGTILPVKPPRDDLEVVATFMYTVFNEPFHKGKNEFPVVKEDFEYTKMFMELTEGLLKDGKLKTHPEEVGKNGLEGALQGMEDMKAEKVSGVKLVYNVADTPSSGGKKVEFS